MRGIMGNIKQKVSCEKSIRISILTASMYKTEKEWDDKEVKEFCFVRFGEIKRRFKYHIFMEIANDIIKSKVHYKTINAKLDGKTVKVTLEYGPLEEYLKSFDEFIKPVQLKTKKIK